MRLDEMVSLVGLEQSDLCCDCAPSQCVSLVALCCDFARVRTHAQNSLGACCLKLDVQNLSWLEPGEMTELKRLGESGESGVTELVSKSLKRLEPGDVNELELLGYSGVTELNSGDDETENEI